MALYADIVTEWQKKNILTAADLATALNGHAISFAYHSGKIENDNITYNDTREIFDHDGVTSYTGDLKTLFEIRNSKDAYELLLSDFEKHLPITEDLIKRFHVEITKNTYDTYRWQKGERPGQYKIGDYITGKNEVGLYPNEVPEAIQDLLSEIQNISSKNALVAAAYFHASFENIHPFADGNGRTGRLLLNYFLITHNHPPLVIYQEDRARYFDALEAWDTQEELNPLIDFLTQEVEKTWGPRIQCQQRPSLSETLSRMESQFQEAQQQAEQHNRDQSHNKDDNSAIEHTR